MAQLNVGNWLQIAALIVAATGVLIAAANYLAGRRERVRNFRKGIPLVRAWIDTAGDDHGWRRVQLHIQPKDEGQPNLSYQDWCIERARLIKPSDAILARAQDDDYASGAFYAEHPARVLEGKPKGKLQRFALEFFIRFSARKRADEATFQVTLAHVKTQVRRTVLVSTSVDSNL